MAIRSIARLYDNSSDARMAVSELETAGFRDDEISYMGRHGEGAADNDETVRTTPAVDGDTGSGAATGATVGTVLGGGAGLLAGLGALAIPGLGPVVAAGWLVATLAGAGVGAAAGGVVGGLAGAGFGEEDATYYDEGLRRGGHMVIVRTEEGRAMEAERILDRHNPVDRERRTADWRNEGWGNDGVAGPGGTNAGMTTGTAAVGPGGLGGPGLADPALSANDPTRRRGSDVA
jgi:hypothetical protein